MYVLISWIIYFIEWLIITERIYPALYLTEMLPFEKYQHEGGFLICIML